MMGRLIDKDALPENKFPAVQCKGFGEGQAYRQGWNDAIDAIVENEPTVDAVPVVHGRWIKMGHIEHTWLVSKCSVCGNQTIDAGTYCTNCGARMDGKGNGNETD